jgi:hypothetical protein
VADRPVSIAEDEDNAADAERTVGNIRAWVGWEMWGLDHQSIVLDGEFTLAELEALVAVLRRDLLAS